MDISNATPDDLRWIGEALTEAMNETDQNGRVVIHGWVRNIMRTTKNRASADKATSLLRFQIQNVARVVEMLRNTKSLPDNVKAAKLRQAEQLLDKVFFPGYARASIEWMANVAGEEKNIVSELIAKYPELIDVLQMEQGRANKIIETIRQPGDEAIKNFNFHVGPMRPGKTERDRANKAKKTMVKIK
jgi:hypothetical protein